MSDDLISRKDAISALKALEESAPTAQHVSAIFDCEDTIRALPSAEPERTAKVKKKRFLGTTTNTIGDFTSIGLCGNCDCEVNEHYAYCPSCGCRLEWK